MVYLYYGTKHMVYLWFNGTYSIRNTENFTTIGVAHLFLAVVFFRDFDAGQKPIFFGSGTPPCRHLGF